ncbi:MAG: hypothetical protein NTY66_04700 [Candidatus Vogelbacteria bacterium]|nr:hypothetical protein [Candidatus Vogelbacteria bacterium]
MTLTTHAIVGASVAQFFPGYPVVAFLAAIASHYLSDRIPHYNLGDHLNSLKRNETGSRKSLEGFTYGRSFIRDGSIVGGDLILGVLLAFLFWTGASPWLVGVGCLGGLLPDLLQIAYGFWNKNKILLTLRRFHDRMHAPRETDIKDVSVAILIESSFVAVVLLLSKLFLA